MIKITDTVIRKQENFWCQCVFHPTDAIEDPWGRRILDTMAEERSINTIRMYSMFEDIVYIDGDGKLAFDYRLSDLRLDYMVEKGFRIFLAYAGMPDCIANDTKAFITGAKGKTRYKGKLWNTTGPKDFALWEEICYQYTKHIVERYGIETVATWRLQCFNEPDHVYLLSSLTGDDAWEARLAVYTKMYEGFARSVCRVSEKILIGGPSLASKRNFLGGFLDYVKEHNLKLDFISAHYYGTSPKKLIQKIRPIMVSSLLDRHAGHLEVIREHGFEHLPILMDEWGMSCAGFANKEVTPDLMVRESELFSAYYVRLIRSLLNLEVAPEALMICLSGQHEMTEEFTGFRGFFTLNFVRKPIYNAHVLASKLKEQLLEATVETDAISVIPTKDENGNYAVLLSYTNNECGSPLEDRDETLVLEGDLSGKALTVYCIDKEHTNPYRLWQKDGEPEVLTDEQLATYRKAGKLEPLQVIHDTNSLHLHLTANATYLIVAE